jgi:tetratricopeptide (TPR) repeat protein/CHAT domain-containing protein
MLAASRKDITEVRRQLVCILLACLLLPAQVNLASENPDIQALGQQFIELEKAGKYQEAIPLGKELLTRYETVLGPENPYTATNLNNLAVLYAKIGNYADAEPLLQRALKIREKALGPENPDTVASLSSLAELYRETGDYARAKPLCERAVAICERALGPSDPITALSLNNLGLLLKKSGDFAKAEALYQRALQIRENAFGPEDAATAESLNNLAGLYSETGRYSKAESLSERALAIKEKILGPAHPDTLLSMNNLAVIYQQMAHFDKAEQLYKRALNICEKSLGADHAVTLSTDGNLATLYERMAGYGRAEPLLQRILHTREKLLGLNHPDTALSLSNLAYFYNEIADYDKARPLLEAALNINEKVFGPDHPSVALNLNNLAFVFDQTGDYTKAATLYERSLAINQKALGLEHPDTARSLGNLAEHYEKLGQYAKAKAFAESALEVYEKAVGPKHPEIAYSFDYLASIYKDIGDYSKAKVLYERALSIRERFLGLEHPVTASSANNLAELYQELGDYTKAKPLLERALRVYEKTLGPEHPSVVATLNNIAQVYENTGDHHRAESLLTRVLGISEKARGPDDADTAIILNNLASLYHHAGEYSKAEPLYERALRLREKTLGTQHRDTVLSLTNLSWLKLDAGKIAEARALAAKSVVSRLKVLSNMLSFCSEQQRLAYQNTVDPYSLFAAIDGSDSELALACLRYKGVVLDSIIEDRVLAEASQKKEEQETVQHLDADKQRLGQLLLETPKLSTDQNTKQVQQLEQEVEQIEGKLAGNVADLGRPRRALAVRVEEVQAAIPADGALIEYLRYQHYLGKAKFEPSYGVIVLTSKGKPRWIPIGRADEIEKSVSRYRNQVTDPDIAEQILNRTLRGLFDQVWAPVQKALPDGTRTVIISPDGQLNFISFATLLTSKDRFLAEDYSIHYVSRGRDLLHDAKLAPNSQVIAFGNPDFSLNMRATKKDEPITAPQIAFRGKTRLDLEELGLDALPGTKAECAVLAGNAKQWKWPSTQFLAADATEAELRKVKSPYILHLATHGFVLNAQKEDQKQLGLTSSLETKSRYLENPMHRAGLALAGAQTTIDAWRKGEVPPTENDGIVTAEEVSALNLEGTWLVTLSACNTGGGEAKSGEGVLGLRRGFIQAGAKNLLMTLWPISDETTVDIMAQFYDAAHKTGNAPQALAQIQRDWLVKLRKSSGLVKSVNLAGPFILSSQGKP